MSKRRNAPGNEPLPNRGAPEQPLQRGVKSMLVDTSPDALIALAPDSTVLFWSKGAESVYGYTGAETVGVNLWQLVASPERIADHEQIIRQVIESGLAVYETVHRKKDGSAIYVDITAKAVRDDRGKLEFVTASHKDVTQIKVSNHSRILEARYFGLLESVPDAIVMVNNTGRIVLANSQAETLFGYSKQELLGQSIEILLPQRFRDGHISHRTRYFSEPKTRTMGAGLELFAYRSDGTEFPVEISLSPLRTEEGTFAMSAIRDITDRKKLQEELRAKNQELEQQNRLIQQANRLKSEFLANMSHELRTPLNGIIGFAEIMHDEKVGPISADHKEYLADILTSGRHLLQLINDVLDLSKVEAGKFEFTPEIVDPKVIVGEVRDIVRALAAKKRIHLKVDIDSALGLVQADARSLKQILYNYVSNALKFTPDEGKVTVRVDAEGANDFRIEVEDTGIGIRREAINRLFVEFQQLDAGSAKQYPGTGLGLALTRKIVEAQGGRVGVSSIPGKGSIFHAILPKFPLGAAVRSEAQPASCADSGAPVILVIEDDANDRAWIAGVLRAAGYAVETAATGAAALQRCRERKFDAITLDIILPDMNGRAVLERLRESGLQRDTPVVVATLLPHKAVVAGFHVADILPKPLSRADLLKSLEKCGVGPHTPQPILVVDDDQSALKLADEMLRRLGYRTVCRHNAASALRAASRERPAAVVLDLIMPEMNGFEFLKRFRKTSRGRSTPVIVWTSKDLTDAEKAELCCSTDAITKKDDQADELIHEIRSVLRLPTALAQHADER